MKDFKKFDIHVHADLNGGCELPYITGEKFALPSELREMYREHGIDKGVLLPCVSPEMLFSFQSNEAAYKTVAENSDILVWFCSLDPRMGYNNPKLDMSYILEHYKKLGALGVGELTANLPFDCDVVDNLFYHCAKCGMPVTIHIAPDDKPYGYYGLKDGLGLKGLEGALKKHPTLKLLGHSAMFWSHISGNVTYENMNSYPSGRVTEGGVLVRLMREYPNLYGDMSAGSGANAFMRDPEFGCAFIEEFRDRLLYGSDFCSVNERSELSFWLDEMLEKGNIREDTYRMICRDNALALLGID